MNLDIFNSDAFSLTSLTDSINNLKYIPGRLAQLGIFSRSGITTTTAYLELKDGVLDLVPTTPRGGPGVTTDKSKRRMFPISVPHIQRDDAIMAEEVQNVRAWGSESALETVQGRVTERMGEHTQALEVTEEYARIGAMKGIITYPTGSATADVNLFTLFGVSQEAEVDLNLTATGDTGLLRKAVAGIVRTIANNLGGSPFSGVLAEVSDTFFDALIANEEVRNTFKNTSMASVLRDGYVLPNGDKIFAAFEFGGVIWENYRGAVGSTKFIDDDKAHLFPIGVPGLFKTIDAPADYVETVNTVGKPRYVKQFAMPNDKGINMEIQANNFSYCTRPLTLMKAKIT